MAFFTDVSLIDAEQLEDLERQRAAAAAAAAAEEARRRSSEDWPQPLLSPGQRSAFSSLRQESGLENLVTAMSGGGSVAGGTETAALRTAAGEAFVTAESMDSATRLLLLSTTAGSPGSEAPPLPAGGVHQRKWKQEVVVEEVEEEEEEMEPNDEQREVW